MSGDCGWRISKSGAIAPPSGSLLDSAYLVRLARGSWTREVVVEFADSSRVVSTGYAEEVARRFLGDVEPPQHLRVEVSGKVSVLAGPRESAVDADGSAPTEIEGEPRRARIHRRGASAL
jgi:hypothetical protein